MSPIPVLMYHHVNQHKDDMVTITPDVFECQMKYLQKNGYATLTIDKLIDYINGEFQLTQKAVVITFDDGWLDNYIYAFPVLEKYKIHASIFIVADRTEKASENSAQSPSSVPNHKESKSLIKKGEEQKVALNWRLIKKIADTGLVDFYSHTMSHRECDKLSEAELSEELKQSKKIIERQLNRPCPYLCWPYGKYNDAAIRIARDSGYKAVFTVEHGIVKPGSDPLAIKRIVVKANAAWFKKRMLIYTNSILSELYLRIKKNG